MSLQLRMAIGFAVGALGMPIAVPIATIHDPRYVDLGYDLRAAELGRYDDATAAAAHVTAAAALHDIPLHLLNRRDVGPGTSNQWLLHYRVEGSRR